MKKLAFGLLVVALSASPVWAAGLKLTIGNGHVSIDAQDVTIRQILTEWARLGKTRIVNLEGVVSGPITLKLDNVPEDAALDIILRTIPGYMAAPRSAFLANASVYDRILIMTTASAVTNPRPAPGAAVQSPNVTQLRPPGPLLPGMLPDPGAEPQEDPAIAAAAAAGLMPVPGSLPGVTTLMPDARLPLPNQTAPLPTPSASPSNPWNVAPGASLPGLAPPPPPPMMPDMGIRRPPQADR